MSTIHVVMFGSLRVVSRRLFPVINTVSIDPRERRRNGVIATRTKKYSKATEFGKGIDNVYKIWGKLNRSSETAEWKTFRCWKPRSFGTV